MRRGCSVPLEVVLRDRFLLEVRRCRRVIFVLRACTAMRLGLRSRLVRAAPGRIRAVVRRLRSVRPALLESTAIQVGFLRRPELAVRARFLQPELPKRSVCPVLPASTAIRRGWASRLVTAVRGPFPPEARPPLRARPVLLACFAMLPDCRRRPVAAMWARTIPRLALYPAMHVLLVMWGSFKTAADKLVACFAQPALFVLRAG